MKLIFSHRVLLQFSRSLLKSRRKDSWARSSRRRRGTAVEEEWGYHFIWLSKPGLIWGLSGEGTCVQAWWKLFRGEKRVEDCIKSLIALIEKPFSISLSRQSLFSLSVFLFSGATQQDSPLISTYSVAPLLRVKLGRNKKKEEENKNIPCQCTAFSHQSKRNEREDESEREQNESLQENQYVGIWSVSLPLLHPLKHSFWGEHQTQGCQLRKVRFRETERGNWSNWKRKEKNWLHKC